MATPPIAIEQGKREGKQNEMDFDALLKAIKEHLIENKSCRGAARDNGLCKSTLSRYCMKVREVFNELSTVSDVQLMDFIRKSRMFQPSKLAMSTSKKAAQQPKKVGKQNEMDFDALLKAIKEHLIENKSRRAAALHNGVDKNTVSRHCVKVKDEFDDLSSVSDVQLMNFIRKSNMHLPSTMCPMDEENEQNELESDALVKAIKHCLSGKIGVRPTAREYNLHHATLQRHVNNVMVAFEDVSTVADSVLMDFVRKKRMKLPTNMVFSLEVENELVEYIMKCIKDKNSLSVTELKQMAYELATKLGICPEPWKKNQIAGKKWYYKFMNRHPELSLNMREQVFMISEILSKNELQAESDPLQITTPSKTLSHEKKTTAASIELNKETSPIKQESIPAVNEKEATTSLSNVLESIDPSQIVTPQRKSKRGRIVKSIEPTSSENKHPLETKDTPKIAPSKKTSPPSKRSKPNSK